MTNYKFQGPTNEKVAILGMSCEIGMHVEERMITKNFIAICKVHKLIYFFFKFACSNTPYRFYGGYNYNFVCSKGVVIINVLGGAGNSEGGGARKCAPSQKGGGGKKVYDTLRGEGAKKFIELKNIMARVTHCAGNV